MNYASIPQTNQIDINLEYTDDIGNITSSYSNLGNFKHLVPEHLNDKDLIIKQVNRKGTSWKKCKYLGSLLDTTEDIKRLKILSITVANKIRKKFKTKIQHYKPRYQPSQNILNPFSYITVKFGV